VSARDELAAAQEALVAALVAGGPPPAGFDPVRLATTTRALLRKRAGEVARHWPVLAASYGPGWAETFAGWAARHPTRGSWLDGWDFALANRAILTEEARFEADSCAALWAHREQGDPRRRRFAVRPVPGGIVVNIFGRLRVVPHRARRA
jgi:hypothetical protein